MGALTGHRGGGAGGQGEPGHGPHRSGAGGGPDNGGAPGWVEHTCHLLEERHTVAWSRNLGLRERYGLEIARVLREMPDTQLCVLAGTVIHDLDGFCRQLERAVPGAEGERSTIRRTINGPGGVVDRLRARSDDPVGHPFKRRYYLWRDADVLLKHNAALFGQLVDALAGVAAESEYVNEDLLLIHRAIFVGGPDLDVYGEDERGQFRAWLPEPRSQSLGGTSRAALLSPGRASGANSSKLGRGLWAVISGVETPPVARFEIRSV